MMMRASRAASWSLGLALALAPGLAPPSRGGEAADPGSPLAARVHAREQAGAAFPVFELLRGSGPARAARGAAPALQLALDGRTAQALRRARPDALRLPLPTPSGRRVELVLEAAELAAGDFKVVSSASRGAAVPYVPALHYRGVVEGEPGSVAALSVFDGEVMGFYQTAADGTITFGKAPGQAIHVLQPDLPPGAAAGLPPFACATPFEPAELDGAGWTPLAAPADDVLAALAPEAVPPQCIRIYVEANTDMFENKGSVQAVVDYVTGVFNQANAIFANENLPVKLSEVFVWTTPSPYTNPSFGMLGQFQQFRNAFNGDLGILLSFKFVGGVAASISGVCNANVDSRQCMGGIQSSFASYPAFSHTVNVFTHELGHLLGSPHTHACAWNGNNTAIDGCAAPEGSCPRPGLPPPGGGTVMSYCPSTTAGTDFRNGFGPQPGARIRARYAAATCLLDCGTSSPNLALNRPATGSTPCNADEGAAKAVNGSVGGGNGDKWCSLAPAKFLQVDLGSSVGVGRFVVKHAAAGGEIAAWNTRAFEIQTSTDGVDFTTVVSVDANTEAVSTHQVPQRGARYVRLNVVTPAQNANGAARIYELEVYAN